MLYVYIFSWKCDFSINGLVSSLVCILVSVIGRVCVELSLTLLDCKKLWLPKIFTCEFVTDMKL